MTDEQETSILTNVEAALAPNNSGKAKYLLWAAAAVAAVTIFSPIYEQSQVITVGDMAIYRTCYNSYGMFFPYRWSCESKLNGMGLVTIGLGCAFGDKTNKKSLLTELCQEIEKAKKENDRD